MRHDDTATEPARPKGEAGARHGSVEGMWRVVLIGIVACIGAFGVVAALFALGA